MRGWLGKLRNALFERWHKPSVEADSPLREMDEELRDYSRAAGLHNPCSRIAADLQRVDFADAYLEQCCFDQANLGAANMRSCRLALASFKATRLEGANLKSAQLTTANLEDASLKSANLDQASLRGANLKGVVFAHASLSSADLSQAKLDHADFGHADLKSANLIDAREIHPDQFRGANLNGTQWSTVPDWTATLKRAEDLSKNAGTPFVASLIAVAFAWVTIASTTDLALLTGTGTTKLPIVNLDIGPRAAFTALPVTLLCFYVYLHLYLTQLWETMALLPAVFPDGRTITERTHPWLINDVATVYLPRLKETGRSVSRLHQLLISGLVWWLIPFTLVGFWSRYLSTHDWFVSIVQSVCVLFGFGLALRFRQYFGDQFSFANPPRQTGTARAIDLTGQLLIVISALLMFSAAAVANAGLPGPPFLFPFHANLDFADGPTTGSEKNIKDWSIPQSTSEARLRRPRIYGIGIPKGYNLRRLSAKNATLIGARFNGTDLSYANLSEADLTYASLEDTVLYRATLGETDLTAANLYRAKLNEATLNKATLNGAVLTNAFLREAVLTRAHLVSANLAGADLYSAFMGGAHLKGANLKSAEMTLASLGNTHLKGADLTGANLTGAYLVGANLEKSNLSQAILEKADLSDANLDGANLTGAHLAGARYTDATRWPRGFAPRSRGATRVSEESPPLKLPGIDVELHKPRRVLRVTPADRYQRDR